MGEDDGEEHEKTPHFDLKALETNSLTIILHVYLVHMRNFGQ